MKRNRFVIVIAIVALLSTVLVGAIAAAELPWPKPDEWDLDILGQRDLVQAQEAFRLLGTTGLLLAPDSDNARVMAFDPTTGDLVDPNFIPSDPVHLLDPKNVILSASGNSLLVSDSAADVVHEYDLLGNYMGVFAPAGGPNSAILAFPLGIALRPNGNLLVTVGSGSNANAVAEFDTDGNYLGNFIENGSGGLDFPLDIYQRSGDWLVSSADGKVKRFSLTTGAFGGNFASVEAPGQLAETPTSNVLVANFSGQFAGILELAPNGALIGIADAVSENIGVYELPNGNFLTTTSSGVYEISRIGALVDTKFDNNGGQFIEFILPPYLFIDGEKSAANNVIVGEPLTYTISVRNFGVDAPGVVMTDAVPAGTSYIPSSLSCQGAAGSCTFDSANNQITWSGDLDNGDALTVTYALNTSAAECGAPISTQAVFSDPATPFEAILGHEAQAWRTADAYDFETNDGGFVANTPPGVWEWGALVPSPGSPPAPISGSNLWATNLSGDITTGLHYLTKTLNLADGPSQVTWWDWRHESAPAKAPLSGFDPGGFVLVNGAEVYSSTLSQPEWVFHSVDLTPWQNQTVDLTYFANHDDVSGAGWYVDDVTVFGCAGAEADYEIYMPVVLKSE